MFYNLAAHIEISLFICESKFDSNMYYNTDTIDSTKGCNNYLSNLRDTFSLNNLMNGKTCFKTACGTSVDVMLTNRPRSVHKVGIIETGFSDHHKLILTFF